MQSIIYLTKTDPEKHERATGHRHPDGAYRCLVPVPSVELPGSALDREDDASETGFELPESLLGPIERACAAVHTEGDDPEDALARKRLEYFKARIATWGAAPVGYDERRGFVRQAAHEAFGWGVRIGDARGVFQELGFALDPLEDVYSRGSAFLEWGSCDAEILADEQRREAQEKEAAERAAEAEAREQASRAVVEKKVSDLPQRVDAIFIQTKTPPYEAPMCLDLHSPYRPAYQVFKTRHGVFPGVLIDAFGLTIPAGKEAGNPDLGWVVVSPDDATVTGTARALHSLPTTRAAAFNKNLLDCIRNTRPDVDRRAVGVSELKTGTNPSTPANEEAFEALAFELVGFAMQKFHVPSWEGDPAGFARGMVASEARARLLHPNRAVGIVSRVAANAWSARKESGELPAEWCEEALFKLFERVYSGEGAELSPGEHWEEAPAHVVNRELAKAPDVDPWRDTISSFCEGKDRFVMRDLETELRALGLLGETTQPSERPRIFRILLSLGWTRKQKMSDGRRVWYWVHERA